MRNVYRARFSALTEKDIKFAMNNLVRPNMNESLSVDARQELDLRIGCAFTRFQTKYFNNKYGDLNSACISFGPCQTPTLGFCVKRMDEIVSFKPVPYWQIQCSLKDSNGEEFKVQWSKGSIYDREVINFFFNRIKNENTATCSDITTSNGMKEPPQALNTVELLRIASKNMGIGPQDTMVIAEHLYTHGYISYPRTETTQYPSQFDFKSILGSLSNTNEFGRYAQKVLNEGIRRPKRGEDKGDHPPITPMKEDNGKLSGNQRRIYEYICQHFIGSLMKPCKYKTKNLIFNICEEVFTYSTKSVEDPGYTEIMTWQSVSELKTLNNIEKESVLDVKSLGIVEKQTTAPEYLTESELITQMEKYGIGTDASIPVHIANIVQRNYVSIESGRKLVPTKLGVSLVHGYWKIDPELVLPSMRSEVEEQLNLIAKGQANYQSVKEHALNMFKMKFIYFTENIRGMDELFEDSFTTLDACGKPFSRCGKCLRFMKLVDSKPQRLHCNCCNESYNIPISKTGQIKQYSGDKRCPIDQFEILYFSENVGQTIKGYPFCPNCFNNPPFEDMNKKDGCNKCPNVSCEFSSISCGLTNCLNPDCGGILYYDKLTKPKYKISCNLCPITIELFKGANNLKINDKECLICGSNTIMVDYKESSPLPDGALKFNGCLFCSSEVYNNSTLVRVKDYTRSIENEKKFQYSRGNRGRGRGGKRGGHSRGKSSRGSYVKRGN
uniref:DNA topoisomerase n=1 Tax=Strongyloides papillosus TaxID=174720 RepID=A0A0N5B8C4_STREA